MIEFKALGGFELLSRDGEALQSVLAQPKRQALLAYLALAVPHGYHRRETILGLLWPELDDARARAALNRAVHQLRASLGADVVLSRGQEEIGLDWQRFWCDAEGFETAVERGDLPEAVALYRGDLLPGFFVEDAGEFDEWLERQRHRLRQLAIAAVQSLRDQAEQKRDVWAAVRWTQRALQLDPLNELNVRRLMLLLEQNAGRAEALRAYEELAKALQSQVGVDPDRETRALRDAIAARDVAQPALTAIASPPPPPSAVITTPTFPVRPGRPAHPPRRKALVLSVAGVLVLAVGVLVSMRLSSSAAADEGPNATVAVLAFPVRNDSAGLFANIAGRFSDRLDHTSEFRAVSARRVARHWLAGDSTELTGVRLRELGKAIESRFVVTGAATRYNHGYVSIHAALYDTAHAEYAVAHGAAAGTVAALDSLIDKVVWQLASAKPTTNPKLQPTSLLESSTAGQDDFVEGQGAYDSGRFAAAVAAFQKAVAADSTNALAYLYLSRAANFSGDFAMTEWAIARAIRFDSKLAPAERLYAQAWDAYLHSRPRDAAALVQTAIAQRPTDMWSWYLLGETRFHWGPMLGMTIDEAASAFDRALSINPDFVAALVHRVRLAAVRGELNVVDRLAAHVKTLPLEQPQALESTLLQAFARRSGADCRALSGESGSSALHVATALSVGFAERGELDCLINELTEPRRDTETRAGACILAAHIAIVRGQTAKALEQIGYSELPLPHRHEYRAVLLSAFPGQSSELLAVRQLLAELPEEMLMPGGLVTEGLAAQRRNYLVGLLSVRLGDFTTAEQQARTLAADRSPEPPVRIYAHEAAALIRAELLRTAGKPADALAALPPADIAPDYLFPNMMSYATGHQRWLRAELLHDLKRDDEALRWYGTFPDPAGYDLMYLTRSHVRRAEIYEQRGDASLARHHYQRALALWANAAPELQHEVARIRKRLEVLPKR